MLFYGHCPVQVNIILLLKTALNKNPYSKAISIRQELFYFSTWDEVYKTIQSAVFLQRKF